MFNNQSNRRPGNPIVGIIVPNFDLLGHQLSGGYGGCRGIFDRPRSGADAGV